MFFIFLSGFQPIVSNAFEKSAQKAARPPSRRGKYLNVHGASISYLRNIWHYIAFNY